MKIMFHPNDARTTRVYERTFTSLKVTIGREVQRGRSMKCTGDAKVIALMLAIEGVEERRVGPSPLSISSGALNGLAEPSGIPILMIAVPSLPCRQ